MVTPLVDSPNKSNENDSLKQNKMIVKHKEEDKEFNFDINPEEIVQDKQKIDKQIAIEHPNTYAASVEYLYLETGPNLLFDENKKLMGNYILH